MFKIEMSASSRDEKEEKHVLKYVGDRVLDSSRVKRESRFARRVEMLEWKLQIVTML